MIFCIVVKILALSCQTWQMQKMTSKLTTGLSSFLLKALITVAGLLLIIFSAMAQQTVLSGTVLKPSELLEKHKELAENLSQNQYKRPLFLDSSESSNTVTGNAYAVLDSPFPTVSDTFKNPKRWCDVMILHVNTKYCRANSDTSPSILKLNIGKKTQQALSDTSALEFTIQLIADTSKHLVVYLNAEKGPIGTSSYRITLQVVPLSKDKSFMHLRYSYGYGLVGRLAMQGYLATLGSSKVGFTQTAQNQKTNYIGGTRGAVERNTMRYYLAIEAYLNSLDQPAEQQFDKRLEEWFDATEEYPRQLHEMDKPSYLLMKKMEYRRQQSQ